MKRGTSRASHESKSPLLKVDPTTVTRGAAIISLLGMLLGFSACSSAPSSLSSAIPMAVDSPSTLSGAARSASTVLVPLYVDPAANSGLFSRLISAHRNALSVAMSVIINPNSGPGTASIPAYVSLRSALHAAGISVFGYVATDYGARAISSVEAEIDAWKSYYQPDGIFLDEMAYVSGAESYYTSLTRYAKADGASQVIGNPGADTIPSYINTVDAIIIHESNGIPGPSALGGWHTAYGPQHFGIISSDIAQAPSSAQLAALHAYISLMYSTSEPSPPMYQTLPPYFEQLLSNLAQS